MKEVIFLGKRRGSGSPKAQWPDADLWGVTHANQKYGRLGMITDWSSWWDLHPLNPTPFYRGIKAKRPNTYSWYRTLPGPGDPGYRPLFLLDDCLQEKPPIPAAVVFQWRRVLEAFPPAPGENGSWLTCQVDWMFGHAILEGYEHIILHGHGVSMEPAHMVAHRGVMHWVTLARERGIRVTIVPPSWYIAPEKPYGVAAGGLGVRK